MSKWQKPWRLFGGKCHPTSTGRVSSTGVVIVVWLRLGLKVIVGYLKTCGAQGVANKLLQSQQNVNIFFCCNKKLNLHIWDWYTFRFKHTFRCSLPNKHLLHLKKSPSTLESSMFFFSASRRAQRLADPQMEMNIFPPKKGAKALAPEIFWGAKIPSKYTVENAGLPMVSLHKNEFRLCIPTKIHQGLV